MADKGSGRWVRAAVRAGRECRRADRLAYHLRRIGGASKPPAVQPAAAEMRGRTACGTVGRVTNAKLRRRQRPNVLCCPDMKRC